MTVPASSSKWAHPPRSNTPRSSSSGPPGPCITPSTETCVVVVSFMVAVLSSRVESSLDPFRYGPHVGDVVLLNLHRAGQLVIRGVGSATPRREQAVRRTSPREKE